MVFGPVFQFELLTTARRARYYLLRALYGLILLGIITLSHQDQFRGVLRTEYTIRDLAQFGETIFWVFVLCQNLAVLLLTPALVAGAVADERQRKTLHYLLASQLSGAEIILGKLGARLLLLAVFVTIGVPITSLLSLFGGVDPTLVGWSYAATASTMIWLAGLSILISTSVRRVRDAILVVFVLEAVWLIAPILIEEVFRAEWPALHAVLSPANSWVLASNPFFASAQGSRLGPSLTEALLWMIGLQLGGGLVCILLAVWRLRPDFRQEPGGSWTARLAKSLSGRRRWLPRPECGDEPMLWKERHVSRLRGITRLVLLLVGTITLVLVGYWTLRLGAEAFQDLLEHGLNAAELQSDDRDTFNGFLRGAGALLYAMSLLGVAVTAASGLTSEREEDTWISLIATTLTGEEILTAKLVGAIWSARLLIAALLAMWACGVLTGSLHPFGMLLAMGQLVCYLGFAAAIGLAMSLWARTTARSLGFTIATLLFLNGGYLLVFLLVDTESALIAFGATPYILAASLWSYRDVWSFLGWVQSSVLWADNLEEKREFLALCLLSPLAHGLAAVGITWWLITRFDDLIDRPRVS
jgi:ABC-type transport system involved in multi-copper enzyme maturation permease subunit